MPSVTGYTYRCLIKHVPQNGAEIIVDLHEAFSDMKGPKALNVTHDEKVIERYDINDEAQHIHLGYRMKAELQFWIREMTQHPTFADMVNRCRDSREWQTFFSQDAGSTYTEMKFRSSGAPKPIQGKTWIGADLSLQLESKQLLQETPYLYGEYALPITTEPVVTPPSPNLMLRGQIHYVRRQGTSPGYFVIYGEDSNGTPTVETLFSF